MSIEDLREECDTDVAFTELRTQEWCRDVPFTELTQDDYGTVRKGLTIVSPGPIEFFPVL